MTGAWGRQRRLWTVQKAHVTQFLFDWNSFLAWVVFKEGTGTAMKTPYFSR
jgi:hypothetical protein